MPADKPRKHVLFLLSVQNCTPRFIIPNKWRRRELNPGPKIRQRQLLPSQLVI